MQSSVLNSAGHRCVQATAGRRLSAARLLPVPAVLSVARDAWHGHSSPQQQPHTLNWQPRLLCKQKQCLCKAASSSNGDRGSSNSQPAQQGGSILTWFDRLPPKVQLTAMGALLFVGMFIIPFFQPAFLYGDTSKQQAAQPGMTEVRQAEPSYTEKRKLPRYIPVASELYDFLQDNAMPRKLPDGRSESPGVLRIYLSSMIILGLFYMCSAVVSLILNGVAGVLRAAGVLGPAPPRPKEE